jgi:hypothetical protein
LVRRLAAGVTAVVAGATACPRAELDEAAAADAGADPDAGAGADAGADADADAGAGAGADADAGTGRVVSTATGVAAAGTSRFAVISRTRKTDPATSSPSTTASARRRPIR